MLASACALADDAVSTQAAQSPSANSPAVATLAPNLVTAPDGTLSLAIDFAMLRHWHIYWSNPGDSGGPTRVKAALPPGWTAEPARLPRPQVLGTGDDRAYGYEDSVRVLVPIGKHPDPMPERLEVTVEAQWLVCRESCLMGNAKLTGSVITQVRPAQPTHAFPEPSPAALRSRIEGTGVKRDLIIEAPVELVSETAIFVPGESHGAFLDGGSGPFSPVRREQSLVWRIPFELQTDTAGATDGRLRGLVLAGVKNLDRAFDIDIPIDEGSKNPNSQPQNRRIP